MLWPENIDTIYSPFQKITRRPEIPKNVYFSNKLQFERKLYYYRPELTTRETKTRVVGMRSFIFWLKQERPLALRLCEWAAERFWFFGPYLPKKGITCRKHKKWTPPWNFCIFKLFLAPNFSLNWKFWFFGPNLPKKGVSGRKQKKWTSPLNSTHPN